MPAAGRHNAHKLPIIGAMRGGIASITAQPGHVASREPAQRCAAMLLGDQEFRP